MKKLLLIFGVLFFSLPANSVTLIVDGTGQLTGAAGVNVNGKLHDVSFVDGTCVDLFYGCDDASDFLFQSTNDALMASQALLDYVLIDTVNNLFDSDPSLTQGCIVAHFNICDVITPYGFDNGFSPIRIRGGVARNQPFNSSGPSNSVHDASTLEQGQSSLGNIYTYAVWSTTPVPIPAAGWFFMMALLSLVGIKRKK